jgi:hypothetical protein
VFDEQHNLWTNKFSSVCVCSSQDARFTWTKELRKATPQKKTLRRSMKSPSVLLRTVCARCTGLSGAHTPDCPVHQGTTAQRLVPGGTRRKDHRTVRCGKPTAPTVTCSDRATARRTGHATVRSPVCRRELQLFSNGYFGVGTYIYFTQPAIWRCGSPSNIPRHIVDISKCSNTQVLNRTTRWLA